LRCPLRHGLDVALDLQPRIERIQGAMTLSVELGARLVIVEAGRIPESAEEPRMAILTESLHALGRHGDRIGAILALETGLESGNTLAEFLARLDTGGLGVGFNPANLLVNGFDPIAELSGLRGRIVYALAKDARRGGGSRTAREAPLGHGDIDWLQLLGTLGAMEYSGWVVVERDGSPNTDVAAGVEFLRRLV
jgi:sugar phosphate isomerase/epimerase